MHKEDEREREPSAEDGYSEWCRDQQEREVFGKRTPLVSSRSPGALNDFMMPAEAMKSVGFGEGPIREPDSVKVPVFPKVEKFAESKYEFLRNVMPASGRRDNAVHEWLSPILSRSREERRRMDIHKVPSAFTTLGAKFATALERECRSHGQQKRRSLLGEARGYMRSSSEIRKAYMPGQMILCRVPETMQIDDAGHDSLMVNAFSNMKWLGDNMQHEWLVLWHDLRDDLKNKAAINDRMRMEVLQRCLEQSNRHGSALHYWG